jgi:hypothetical protein
VPWQLFGYGRSDWSTKLIRGLTSEAAAGFQSRRGLSHDSTLVTPHNAPFSTYKAARVHHTARRSRAEDKRRADEAAARRFDELIELPPDMREHQTLSPSAKIEDETPAPSGELHALQAKSEEPEPSLEVEDNVGDLPEELQDPVEPVPEPEGSVYPQPIAISLNKE